MDYIIICITALLGSALTLFSGFGLGTILMPVFGIFFPIELAIAMTAIVHFLNNLFKLALFGKYTDKNILLRFGIPSFLAALAGAYFLNQVSTFEPLASYSINGHIFYITALKLIIAVILIFFVLFDLLPSLSKIQFDKKHLVTGGLLSGFFGGLSGMQGALRSAFLIKAQLSRESFIATGVVIACMVDVARLSIYSKKFTSAEINYQLVIAATVSAFIGVYVGSKLFKKITVQTVQYIVAGSLFCFALLSGFGIL